MHAALVNLLDAVVNTRTKLDVLDYFRGNPAALDTPESISQRLHRAPEAVDAALEQLADAGVLQPTRPISRRQTVYAYAPSEELHAQLDLLWTALAGPERSEVLTHIMQRDIEIRTRELAELRRLDNLKNRFISLVSHKLRTPVTVLKGALDMLLIHPDMPEDKRVKLVELAGKHCTELIALLESLLTMAGLQSGRPLELALEPTSPAEVLEEAVARARARAENCEIVLELSPTPPSVVMDRDKIAMVVDDLLDNAMKFSPSGGHITVSAKEAEGELQVTVQDEGIGLPPAELHRVFERFYQYQAAGEQLPAGPGLGLYLARAVVTAHDGRIWIEDKNSPGLRVRFCLPLRGPNSTPEAADAAPAPECTGEPGA